MRQRAERGMHDRAHGGQISAWALRFSRGHGQRSLITGYTEAKQTYTPLASLAERVHGKQIGKKYSFDTPCNNLRPKYIYLFRII